jgi:hypothetical protein
VSGAAASAFARLGILNAMLRKPRSMQEMLTDPHFTYQVGRLVGAAEMAAHHMQMHGDEETKSAGVALKTVVDWFFVTDQDAKRGPTHEDVRPE